ncbi:predicted arginine uptake transporter [Vibrio sp. JCM 19236]|nr:predicted arginine uptake transporter [Vibrio sp. JCM 19236]
MIIQFLPPLSYKKDTYIDGTAPDKNDELIPEGQSAVKYGYQLALERASKVKSLSAVAKEGLHSALDMMFGVLPVVMAVGTIGLVIAEATPIFTWLGAPFVPVLEMLNLPEATAAAETVLVGFTDMYVPSIIAASTIDSDLTKFVIAALSITQLIFMSETGSVILSSKIPVNIFELMAIFVLRTLITLPIIALCGHMLF